jgi:hypothetical protein
MMPGTGRTDIGEPYPMAPSRQFGARPLRARHGLIAQREGTSGIPLKCDSSLLVSTDQKAQLARLIGDVHIVAGADAIALLHY